MFIISGPGRTVKPVFGAFCVCFRLIKRNVCSKACSRKAKERKNQRSYALLAGAEDGTFPRAGQQSTGLLAPARRCRLPVQVLSSEYQTKIPMAGYAMGTFVWCGRWDFPGRPPPPASTHFEGSNSTAVRTAPAGAFRRPTDAQRRLLGRRWRQAKPQWGFA